MLNNKKIYFFMMILLFMFQNNVYADLRSEAKKNTCEELIENGTIDRQNENLLFTSSYDRNCIYYKSQDESCILFQLSFDSSTGDYEYKAIFPHEGGLNTAFIGDRSMGFVTPNIKIPVVGLVVTYKEVEKNDLLEYKGLCPVSIRENIYVTDSVTLGQFVLNDASPNMTRLYATSVDINIPPLITNTNGTEVKDCKDLLGEEGVNILKLIYNIIRIAIPIILLVLGTLDFVQAIFSGNEEGMKKSQTKFIRRLILSVGIFMIPYALRVILNIAHSIWPVIDNSLCGILE